MNPLFVWDEIKAQSNLNKHGVSFDEATTVFADSFAAVFDDPDHSIEVEHREIIVGYSFLGRLLFVSFTERQDQIRIISSRIASVRERRRHNERANGEHADE